MAGILYARMLGVVFYVGLVSLTSSYPSPCSPILRNFYTCVFLLIHLTV